MNFLEILKKVDINVNLKTKEEVFACVFEMLKTYDAIEDGYLASMIERDQKASVAIGNYLAIPHGEVESKELIKNDAIVLLVLKEPMMWDNNEVKVILGLAISGENTMDVIGDIGVAFSDEHAIKKFFYKKHITPKEVIEWLKEHKDG